MSDVNACPAPDVLKAFARGDFTWPRDELIAAHLATCPHCQSRLASADPDTLATDPGTDGRLPDEQLQTAPEFQRMQSAARKLVSKNRPRQTTRLSTGELPLNVLGYDVVVSLGAGANGAIFRAHDQKSGRPVILRLCTGRLAGHPGRLHGLIRDCAFAAELTGGRVLPVLDMVPMGAVFAIISPPVDGQSLADIVRERHTIQKPGSSSSMYRSTWTSLPDDEYVAAMLGVLRQLVQLVSKLHAGNRRFPELRSSSVFIDRCGQVYLGDYGSAPLLGVGMSAIHQAATANIDSAWAQGGPENRQQVSKATGGQPASDEAGPDQPASSHSVPRPRGATPAAEISDRLLYGSWSMLGAGFPATDDHVLDALHAVHATRPGFISPEEWCAEPHIDARADVFRLGAIMYQALTLRLPFGIAPLSSHSRPPVPPRQRQPLVPTALDEIIMRCLAIRRDARYASAVDVPLP